MTAQPIGNAFGGRGAGRRKSRNDESAPTDPVRAHSWHESDPRANPGRPIGDRTGGYFWAFTDALRRTLEAELDEQYKNRPARARYRRNCIDVLMGALKFCDRATGDFFVSYKEIAAKAKVGRSTAINVIRDIERLGFLAHVRRSRDKEGAEGQAGPQLEQAPNGYYFDCQARMPADLWKLFYKTLLTNLQRIDTAAKRRAALIYKTFNSKAPRAPRPSDKSDLMLAVESLGAGLAPKWAAEGESASPG